MGTTSCAGSWTDTTRAPSRDEAERESTPPTGVPAANDEAVLAGAFRGELRGGDGWGEPVLGVTPLCGVAGGTTVTSASPKPEMPSTFPGLLVNEIGRRRWNLLKLERASRNLAVPAFPPSFTPCRDAGKLTRRSIPVGGACSGGARSKWIGVDLGFMCAG